MLIFALTFEESNHPILPSFELFKISLTYILLKSHNAAKFNNIINK